MEQKNQVGQTLPNGYTVIANYKNRYILTHHSKPGIPAPFAIWNVDQEGDTYSGSYFGKQEDTEKYFTYSCFSWLDESTCIPKSFKKEALRKNENQLDSPFAIYSVRNDGSPMNDDSYYEEIINEQRQAINMNERMIARTTSNAGMALAYIGTSHPAFELVFKHFVNQDYPDFKEKTSSAIDKLFERQYC